ncbi:outer membrane protein assembly factor BamC [Sphaerotilus sp.]|uniref:outer membrane protein assembly factor BamC n=1 Tax=Sphaerotilus sp. TaxID=2093942 RepID=UPI00286E20D9|nr:outer membrane protein assembly factor BamC [Sphaerotilus sp.]
MSLRHPTRTTLTAALLACGLGGCTTVSDSFTSGKIDYRSSASTPAPTLQVPPDLTQLSNDPRYQPPVSGAVSANAMQAAESAPQAGTVSAMPRTGDEVRIERAGNQRWLVVRQTPEQLWGTLRTFWQDNGFTLTVDTPQVGVMETDWTENRAKLPNDIISRTVGKVFDKLRDTGERDRYRTRVERNGAVTEIYISHRGVEQVGAVERTGESLRWQNRPSDPGLEAEMLARLMLRLSGTDDGSKPDSVKAAVEAAARSVGATPAAPARARVIDQAAGKALQIDDNLERSWRRVGLALDRSGFTVEERDRAQNTYLVRYVDPKLAGQEDPGFFSRVFGGARKEDLKGTRYRLKLTSDSSTSSAVSILDDKGAAAKDDGARNIVQLLVNELR